MSSVIAPLKLLVISLAGLFNNHQQTLVDYLIAENRVLKEQLGDQRICFTYRQRIALAAKAKKLGRQILNEIDTLVMRDALLVWHRIIFRKYVVTWVASVFIVQISINGTRSGDRCPAN